MLRVEQMKKVVKEYQENNQFKTIGLKYTNRYEQSYEIQCYQKGKEYYLRQSQAQSCICTPDIQNWMRNKSKDHQERRLAEGASVGTTVHKLAEMFFEGKPMSTSIQEEELRKACLENEILPSLELLTQVVNAYEGFLSLQNKTGMVSVASEVTVHSDQIGVAGTIDRIVLINKDFHIVDFKSGNVANGVKTESQLSFYKLAAEEQFGVPLKCTVFALKKDGTGAYDFTYRFMDMNLRSFLGALSVYQVHEWKNLKTFWPYWNKDFSGVKHKDFDLKTIKNLCEICGGGLALGVYDPNSDSFISTPATFYCGGHDKNNKPSYVKQNERKL